MSTANNWRRVGKVFSGTALKRWYKKLIHRKNRRAARQDHLHRDKKLNPWDVD